MVSVFAIFVKLHEPEMSTPLCQRKTVPVWPDKVSKPLVLPEQIMVPPVTVPPTETGSTVTVAGSEFATAQVPLLATARYWVVTVKSVAV